MSAVTLQIALPILDPECSDKLKIEAQLGAIHPYNLRSGARKIGSNFPSFWVVEYFNGKSIFHAHKSFFQVILLILKASSINLAVLSPERQW